MTRLITPLCLNNMLMIVAIACFLTTGCFCQKTNLDSLPSTVPEFDGMAPLVGQPQPYLVYFSVNGEKQLLADSLKATATYQLKPDQNSLAFEFACSGLTDQQTARYRYRLQGFDKNWEETSHPFVRYTHLPSGRYSFQLLALSSSGYPIEQPLEWHFQILPPWWATWWACLIYLLMASIASYAYYLRKKNKLPIKETMGTGTVNGNKLTPSSAPGNLAAEALLKNLLEALEKNYSDEDFDIATLCRTLGMSRAQCYRKLTALTGEPVAHFIRNFRLQKAKDLLANSSLSISQIALEVGFRDLAHFSHCFHHYYGINASEIRKRDAATNDRDK